MTNKVVRSPNYNSVFDMSTGFFARWGKTQEDDPPFSPFGPEILDIEISTICSGPNGKPCSFCYKSNTARGENMSFETFKKIFDKFPSTLTQIAFGIGDIDSNPDLWRIMEYTRENNVIPNITINGAHLIDRYADKLASLCGAVAVSHYSPSYVCYDAVEKLTSRIGGDNTLKQVNIHQLVSHETYKKCFKVMQDSKVDPKLRDLNAIVFLSLKPKGDRNKFHKLGSARYKTLVDHAFKHNISIGFDSCSAPMFLKAIEGRDDYKQLEQVVEPCESYLFSFYVNVEGKTVPCSFLENETAFEPIDLTLVDNFIKDVWNNPTVKGFRDKLLATEKCNVCRQCPVFDIY